MLDRVLDLPAGPLPYDGLDVTHLLELRATDRSRDEFLVWEPFEGTGRTWTYSEFAHDVASLAGGLAGVGVGPGDCVLLHLDNCPEFLLGWFAAVRLGAFVATTNTRSTLEELTYYAEQVAPVVAITEPRFSSLVSEAAPSAKWLGLTPTDADGSLASGPPPERSSSTASLLGLGPSPLRPPDPRRPLSLCVKLG
jgi:crotonobetaine/carnitine-CoA ligase